jgi:hypothetical protein
MQFEPILTYLVPPYNRDEPLPLKKSIHEALAKNNRAVPVRIKPRRRRSRLTIRISPQHIAEQALARHVPEPHHLVKEVHFDLLGDASMQAEVFAVED